MLSHYPEQMKPYRLSIAAIVFMSFELTQEYLQLAMEEDDIKENSF